MSMLLSDGRPKACRSCHRPSLLEFFSCSACPPQSHHDSYDLCLSCCENYAREAHNENCGPNHIFVFNRRVRRCDWCRNPISEDFMMCKNCPQDFTCYDLCLTCVMSRRPKQAHAASLRHHDFHYIKWLPPDSPGEMKPFQNFKLNWTWNCDGRKPLCAREMYTPFFHCLDCVGHGFDLCSCCADDGGIFQHRKLTGHRFTFVMQTKPTQSVDTVPAQNNEPPPPYRDL